ncbi:hypothetical protein A4A49_20262 [Nicotiana attenuata]|uniref:Uncharacterized protein n=1 Tax=Nicotiana attenuata TaxID=49451 RepID=A0A314KRK8_NICAT|nr:hypothetical protein A4A49_20262 [Nicotiana attenuata]
MNFSPKETHNLKKSSSNFSSRTGSQCSWQKHFSTVILLLNNVELCSNLVEIADSKWCRNAVKYCSISADNWSK